MLLLKKISLTQFRNYNLHQLNFDKNIVGIYGANGVGKTNLLDAIYYLSFCKSYFNRTDSSNATHNFKGFRIEGDFELNKSAIKTTCIFRDNSKKEFYFNEVEYQKFSAHIGQLPSVIITPDDTELIIGASELRRKFIDVILSQTQLNYLQNLIEHNNILKQRNSLLKQYAVTNILDEVLFEILTNQLVEKAVEIFNARKIFLEKILLHVQKNYQLIAQRNEVLTCVYNSQLIDANYKQLLHKSLQSDMFLQRTTIGIHKDDIDFGLGNYKFKSEASQGQRKNLLFALKLSEWQFIEQHKGFAPILLLDDVFEKLDAERMKNLLAIVTSNKQAQVFITDTHKERLRKNLEDIDADFELIQIY